MWWSTTKSDERRVVLAVGPWVIYAVVFIAIHGVVGPKVSVLVMVPVAFVAGLTGMRTGLLAGIIAYPLNLLLARITGDVSGIAAMGGPAAAVSPALLGAAIGWLHDLASEPYALEAEKQRIDYEVNRRLAERTGAALGPFLPDSLPDRWAHHVSVLVDQCVRMAGAVDSVVRVSRLQNQLENASLGPVDLNSVVDEVVVRYQSGAQAAGLLLIFRPYGALPPVNGAAQHLDVLVSCLLDNALEYTQEGMISVSTDLQGERALLHVEDTGTGIESDRLERIRDRLAEQDADVNSRISQLGLGLTIVARIVGLHGGSLEVESAEDEGTTFTVVLPLAES